MEIALSDLVDPWEEPIVVEIGNRKEEHWKDLKLLRDLKKLLRKYDKPTDQIDYYISILEGNMDIDSINPYAVIDEVKIKKLIEKHPYFKNPCDYSIRLITVMKYLKKKGIDISYKDMDLMVDKLIQQIDGVKKVGDGMYIRKIN